MFFNEHLQTEDMNFYLVFNFKKLREIWYDTGLWIFELKLTFSVNPK